MTIRAILMGSYNAEGAKGIIGGSDRMAAIQAVAEAAGGSVNFASFMRGPMDIIVDFNVPDANTLMGVAAASGRKNNDNSTTHSGCSRPPLI